MLAHARDRCENTQLRYRKVCVGTFRRMEWINLSRSINYLENVDNTYQSEVHFPRVIGGVVVRRWPIGHHRRVLATTSDTILRRERHSNREALELRMLKYLRQNCIIFFPFFHWIEIWNPSSHTESFWKYFELILKAKNRIFNLSQECSGNFWQTPLDMPNRRSFWCIDWQLLRTNILIIYQHSGVTRLFPEGHWYSNRQCLSPPHLIIPQNVHLRMKSEVIFFKFKGPLIIDKIHGLYPITLLKITLIQMFQFNESQATCFR